MSTYLVSQVAAAIESAEPESSSIITKTSEMEVATRMYFSAYCQLQLIQLGMEKHLTVTNGSERIAMSDPDNVMPFIDTVKVVEFSKLGLSISDMESIIKQLFEHNMVMLAARIIDNEYIVVVKRDDVWDTLTSHPVPNTPTDGL